MMRFIHVISYVLMVIFLGACVCCTEQTDDSENGISFEYEGQIKWDPDNFPSLPEEAPFELTMQLNVDTLDGDDVLDMQLLLHNPTHDTLHITAAAGLRYYLYDNDPPESTSGVYYDFVITRPDSLRVWNLIQTSIRQLAQANIKLGPEETRHFQYQWHYAGYDGNPLEKGEYLIYGIIEGLRRTIIAPDRSNNERIDYGDVRVGPDTLVID